MQFVRAFESENALPVGLGAHVLLVTSGDCDGALRRRLAGLGGQVEAMDEIFTALSHVYEDPGAWDLVVIDADGFGGLEAARKACALASYDNRKVPTILISTERSDHHFALDLNRPTELRAPLSSIALRVGFEHALRERFAARVH